MQSGILTELTKHNLNISQCTMRMHSQWPDDFKIIGPPNWCIRFELPLNFCHVIIIICMHASNRTQSLPQSHYKDELFVDQLFPIDRIVNEQYSIRLCACVCVDRNRYFRLENLKSAIDVNRSQLLIIDKSLIKTSVKYVISFVFKGIYILCYFNMFLHCFFNGQPISSHKYEFHLRQKQNQRKKTILKYKKM